MAIKMGLHLPIVYDTSSYDSMKSLALTDGIVDIYMPDFKFWDPQLSLRYTKAMDYPQVARRVVAEIHRQVGDLVFGEDGLAKRGLLVRHLVMPGDTSGTREIIRFLASNVSPNTYVNIMGQYHPLWKVDKENYTEINRQINQKELDDAFSIAREEGITRLDGRWLNQRAL